MASTQQTTGAHHTEAATSPVSAPATLQTASGELTEDEKIRKGAVELVEGIINPETREESLSKLGRNREKIPDLGVILWYTPGVMTILIQEIVSVYPILYTSIMKTHKTNICNTLSLLQCVAAHSETCPLLLQSGIYLYLFPFLKIAENYRPYENLRLTSLGVLGALLKNESSDAVRLLLQTEIVPICTNVIRTGATLSKTVAVFILQKLLRNTDGRAYICSDTAMVSDVLNALSDVLSCSSSSGSAGGGGRVNEHQDPLERALDCYLCIAEDTDGILKLKSMLPQEFHDGSLKQHGDKVQKKLNAIIAKLK